MPATGLVSSPWEQKYEEIELNRTFARGAFVAAVAGVPNNIQLSNPSAANRIAQVLDLWVSVTVATRIVVAVDQVTASTLIALGLSMRFGSTNSNSEIRNQSAALGLTLPIWDQLLAINQPINIFKDWSFMVTPGSQITVSTVALAVGMSTSWRWQEREL